MKNPFRIIATAGHSKPRREITVMYVDLVRLADLAQKTDIMAAQRIFNEAVVSQINICNKFSGVVNKVTVNGLMCLFGAEGGDGDHALKAFLAAEEMIEDGKQLQKKLRRTLFDVRVGIHTGDVVLKPAAEGSDRARWQVAGEAVQITERIVQAAKPNTIVVSEACKKHLQSLFSFRRHADIIRTKNKSTVSLFEKSSRKFVDFFPPVESFGALLRTDERDCVIAHLKSPLRQKKPNVTWIEGASGFGKTYLADYAASAAGDVYRNVIRVNFFPQPMARGHNRFEAGILKSILPKGEEKLRSLVLSSAIYEEIKNADLIYNCLCDTLGLRYAVSSGYAFLSAVQKANLRRRIITSLLVEIGSAARTLVLLEDVHWADEAELGYVQDIMHSAVESGHLHLLCTSRKKPPAALAAARQDSLMTVRFDPLTQEQGLSLIASKSFGLRMPENVALKICDLSEGNPYFIQGYLDWIKDRRRAGRNYHDILAESEKGAPVKVANILYARLNELPQETIAVAKLAAVQGMMVDADILAHMSGMFRDDVLAHLVKLQSANILASRDGNGAEGWIFTHELLQKSVYNSIARARRAELHAAVVRVVRMSARHYRQPYRLLQYHAVLSGDERRAYVYSIWASKEAMHASLPAASVQFLNDAQKSLARLKGSFHPARHRAKLDFLKLKSLFVLSRYDEAKRAIKRLLKNTRLLEELNILRETQSYEGVWQWISGNIVGAETIFKTLYDSSREDGARVTRIREAQRLCNICVDLGEYKKAVTYGEDALKMLQEEESHQTLGLLVEIRPAVYSCLSLACAYLGDIGRSLHYLREGQKFLRESNDYTTKTYAAIFLGRALMHFDRYEEAADLFGDAMGHCDLSQSNLLKPYILSAHGVALAHMGLVKEGEKRCRGALKMARDDNARIWLPALQTWHAEVLMMRDSLVMAEKCLVRAADDAEKAQASGWLQEASALLAACREKKKKSSAAG